MPPKKKGGKAPKVVNPNLPTEVEKTFYELHIADLNRKLARLRALTTELEDKNEMCQNELAKVDEDRSDVIIYLKRILQEKGDEVKELEERITALENTRTEETEVHVKEVVDLKKEYNQMKDQLTSENKLLEGKLNSLEEFRVQRDELMKKFVDQEKQMLEQEERHTKELYEIERKFIISKDKLKKDMEARLQQLSTEFQDATEVRIAATTHRVIRENIAVNNQLDVMIKTHQQLFNENTVMRNRDTLLRHEAELHEAEKRKALYKVEVQTKIIKKLTNEHKHMEHRLKFYKSLENDAREAKINLQTANEKIDMLNHKIKLLEQNLENVRSERTRIVTDMLYLQDDYQKVYSILVEAGESIRKVLALSEETETGYKVSMRESFLYSLLSLMDKANEPAMRKPSLESIDSISATYAQGDLGFVPKKVVLRSKFPVSRHVETQTGVSFEEFVTANEEELMEKVSMQDSGSSITAGSSLEQAEEASALFFDDKESIGEIEEEVNVDNLLLDLAGDAHASSSSDKEDEEEQNNEKKTE